MDKLPLHAVLLVLVASCGTNDASRLSDNDRNLAQRDSEIVLKVKKVKIIKVVESRTSSSRAFGEYDNRNLCKYAFTFYGNASALGKVVQQYLVTFRDSENEVRTRFEYKTLSTKNLTADSKVNRYICTSRIQEKWDAALEDAKFDADKNLQKEIKAFKEEN